MENFHGEFRTGDVLFFAGRSPMCRFIALVTLPLPCFVCFLPLLFYVEWPVVIAAQLAAIVLSFAASRNISHVGTIARGDNDPLLYESTTMARTPCVLTGKRVSGGQAQYPKQRVEAYDGHVYLLRLRGSHALDGAGQAKLTAWLRAFVGREYTFLGAMLSGTRVLKWWTAPLQRGLHKFCSQYVAGALKEVDKMPRGKRSSTYHPAGLLRTLENTEMWEPLKLVK